jgi:hypothetical protein
MSDRAFAADSALLARLPAESAVLALTASGRAGDTALEAALRRPLQWEMLLAKAGRERALAPVFERLQRVRHSVADPSEMARLQRMAWVSEFQLASLHDRLTRLLAVYAAAGVEVLLLKGAGLAYSAYATPSERPMGDIDLLVRGDAAGRAFELALANGWRRRSDVPEDRSYDAHQHLAPLEDADGLQIGLELHTALFTAQSPFRFDASTLWAGARRIAIGGSPAFVPSAEAQLVHAALHFAWSHEMAFGAWRTWRDIERIVASGAVDWPAVVRSARESGGATCCFWALRLARDAAGVAVPEEVLSALAPPLPRTILRRLALHYVDQALPSGSTATTSVSVSRALWGLGIQPRRAGHGTSRPWLETDEWAPRPDEGDGSWAAPPRRLLERSVRLLRSVASLIHV